MSRVARSAKTKVLIVVAAIIVIAGIATAVGLSVSHHDAPAPQAKAAAVTAKKQTTQISYQGQAGVDALTLLKKHAAVQTKHYSFGDLVTAINGTAASGSKYWILYVNGQESKVGASSYITKNSDKITWKLQS